MAVSASGCGLRRPKKSDLCLEGNESLRFPMSRHRRRLGSNCDRGRKAGRSLSVSRSSDEGKVPDPASRFQPQTCMAQRNDRSLWLRLDRSNLAWHGLGKKQSFTNSMSGLSLRKEPSPELKKNWIIWLTLGSPPSNSCHSLIFQESVIGDMTGSCRMPQTVHTDVRKI